MRGALGKEKAKGVETAMAKLGATTAAKTATPSVMHSLATHTDCRWRYRLQTPLRPTTWTLNGALIVTKTVTAPQSPSLRPGTSSWQ